MTGLQSITGEARFELEVRKSRHIAIARPVATPDEAMDLVAGLADPAATHNCWAYRIGALYRFSDDGEPAGTAGRPILAAIEGQGIDHVVVLVTRWFGGTKLGAGGLARAYGGAAAECLRRAPRRDLVAYCEAGIDAGFEYAGTLHSLLAQFSADKLEEHYRPDGIHVRLRLPCARLEELDRALADTSRGQVHLKACPGSTTRLPEP